MTREELINALRDECKDCNELGTDKMCYALYICPVREAADEIESLQAQLAQVTAERDAAVKDIKKPSVCDCCKCACQGDDDCIDSGYVNFEWRGPQKEN